MDSVAPVYVLIFGLVVSWMFEKKPRPLTPEEKLAKAAKELVSKAVEEGMQKAKSD